MAVNEDRVYMDQIFNEYVKIGKALSSEKRIELLHRLVHGAKTVEQLARITDMSVANTSRHLQTLKEANLVAISKQGKYVYYTVATSRVENMLNELHLLSEEQLPSLRYIEETFDKSDEAIKTLSLSEALEIFEHEKVQLVDLRCEKEFLEDHMPNAINIPYSELEERLEELDKECSLILYCRGRFCPYTNHASAYLNKLGYNAYSVNVSHFDWRREQESHHLFENVH